MSKRNAGVQRTRGFGGALASATRRFRVELGRRIAESGTKDLSASPLMTYELHGASSYPDSSPSRIKKSVSASLVTHLARHWVGGSLITAHTAMTSIAWPCSRKQPDTPGCTSKTTWSHSEYWSAMPLHQRAIVLLFLVDRGVVERGIRRGRRVYEPLPHAESWVESQPSLRPYLKETLELVAALRREHFRRVHSRAALIESIESPAAVVADMAAGLNPLRPGCRRPP